MAEAVTEASVLLVDDEDNILKSLRRTLRREPCQVYTAGSGEEALELLALQGPVDLVISDARMPGMDGATLLATVKDRWPDCIRILLTGYADITTTIKAINDGRIYRYIPKPWDDEELRLVIRQALAYQFSERERKRLEALTSRQNDELQHLNEELRSLNANLEERVRARTEELQETADMLDLAYDELRHSYTTATEVFSSLINQRMPADRQPNSRVIALVKAYAETYELGPQVTQDLTMAAALYNLGKLSWPDSLFNQPSDMLSKEQRKIYRQYPGNSEHLLMALEPLQGAARIIRHHQERWNGRGFPNELAGEQIPFTARLLKLAVDFIELQCGLIIDRKVLRDKALILIKRHAERLYDPELCDQFLAICTELAPDIEPQDPNILALDTRRLEPGMVIARALHANSGMLLLNEGKMLTPLLVEKLRAFEEVEAKGARYTVFVRNPEPATTEQAS
jgi:response regulator RpfG family c-di-GMP phosphodiesterase